jgi:hypothetical protein
MILLSAVASYETQEVKDRVSAYMRRTANLYAMKSSVSYLFLKM